MQAYLKVLLEEEARRARNGALLREVRNIGGGCVTEDEEAVQEIRALRAQRDARNAGAA